MDRYRSERFRFIPLAFPLNYDEGFWIIVALIKATIDDDFDGDINDIVWAASFIVI